MSIVPESKAGKFLFLPKMGGEDINVTILGEVIRVKSPDDDRFNYKKKGGIDVGYYDIVPVIDEATGEEISLLISTWVFYFLLKEQEDLEVGDTVTIAHPAKNEYTITKK